MSVLSLKSLNFSPLKCHGHACNCTPGVTVSNKCQILESTGAAPGLLHPHPTCTDVACGVRCCWLCIRAVSGFFFFFVSDLCQSRLILAETGAEMADTAWFWLKRTPKRSATMSLASILLLHVALWEKKKKKEREREKEEEIRTPLR